MLCIVCLKDKPDGNEHSIPKSIGGSFVTPRVCTDCDNGPCSKADAELVTYYKLEERRIQFKLKGNNGTVPDPVRAALKGRVDSGIAPGHQLIVNPVPSETGMYSAKTAPNVKAEVVNLEDGGVAVRFTEFFLDVGDAAMAPILIRSALKKAGLKDEELLNRVTERQVARLVENEVPKTITVPIKQNGGGYTLGLLKIAYEFAHDWLGDSWLADPVAEQMRKALKKEAHDGGRFQISETIDGEQKVEGFDPAATHAVILMKSGNGIVIHIRLLGVLSAYFVISDTAAKYAWPETDGVVMNVKSKTFDNVKVVVSPATPVLKLLAKGDAA